MTRIKAIAAHVMLIAIIVALIAITLGCAFFPEFWTP